MDMYIFFDVEATSGNPKDGDIVEIAMKTDPKTCKQERSFQSVKSGITKKRLIDPNINEFKVVYKNMMKWLKNRVQKAREWYKKVIYPRTFAQYCVRMEVSSSILKFSYAMWSGMLADRHRAMGDVNAMLKIFGDKLWEHLPQLRILTYKSFDEHKDGVVGGDEFG
ncbi:PREDICTED: uncharacterized protein LOC100215604, partial [Paramuricea clavata]